MAPTLSSTASELEKRAYYGCSGYGYYYGNGSCYYSGWNAWGRWVLLAVIIIAAFLIFLLFSCITARRRRRAGRNPYPMTGWATRPQAENNYNSYNQGYGQQGYSAPPAYGQPQQQYGVTQPQPVYGNNRDMGAGHYAPPEGPPPGKGDHVVR